MHSVPRKSYSAKELGCQEELLSDFSDYVISALTAALGLVVVDEQ